MRKILILSLLVTVILTMAGPAYSIQPSPVSPFVVYESDDPTPAPEPAPDPSPEPAPEPAPAPEQTSQ